MKSFVFGTMPIWIVIFIGMFAACDGKILKCENGNMWYRYPNQKVWMEYGSQKCQPVAEEETEGAKKRVLQELQQARLEARKWKSKYESKIPNQVIIKESKCKPCPEVKCQVKSLKKEAK